MAASPAVYVANPDNRADAVSDFADFFPARMVSLTCMAPRTLPSWGCRFLGKAIKLLTCCWLPRMTTHSKVSRRGLYYDSKERGTHGYLNTDPKMQAIFMAWGAGVPKGVHLGNISTGM